MKRGVGLLWAIGAATAASGIAGAAQAGTIAVRYEFGQEENLGVLRQELHPVVPVRVARILLPTGAELVSARFTPTGVGHGVRKIEIAGRQRPMSKPARDEALARPFVAWDGRAYPDGHAGEAAVREFRGQRVVEVPLYPVQVLGDGTAETITGGELVIETSASDGAKARVRGLARDRAEATFHVDNPDTEALAAAAEHRDPEGYLIIGPEALIGTEGNTPLADLIAEKRGRGLSVELAKLETVSARKDPAEIRAYIKQKFTSAGIDYVLLVGDHQRLPWKKLRAGTGDSSEPIPSDQYYACLDGDFSNTSSYDWSCEVAVGRVGARTREDVEAWTAKTLALLAASRARRTGQVLNFGEKLDGSTLGSWVLEHLVTGLPNGSPATVGFPASTTFTKKYDTFSREVPASEFVETLNDGDFHVVNHLGHANETYVFRMSANEITELQARPGFYYTQGCYPNDPDYDNWTVRAVRTPQYGPAAMISNTRYGWYEPGQGGEGSSAVQHRAFWSTRFGDGVKQVGRMNHKGKELVIGADRSSLMIYTLLESNLIGDPELDLEIQ